ncbi:hypothetical protein EIP91_003025 [Steccherinum ochraceum]|uniref:Major facilitator superfamily (MFS) profile domain-containing protein n=1 Tax=Steccherinum ochraceum TaxID=92696 RepID=A0A4R0RJJ9_9APHY|nr:hypothetical protein EIP91_003025 [Steccherinum ochraceum]
MSPSERIGNEPTRTEERSQHDAVTDTDTLSPPSGAVTPTLRLEKEHGHHHDITALDTHHVITKDFGFLPIPARLQHHPDKPHKWTLTLNIVFGVASTFLVANLYYCQPLLIQLAESFNVTYNEVSRIPTLVQAGYAVGLLFISPLGDLVRRRPLLILLTFLSASLSIGLPLTRSVVAFEVLSFFVGIVTVVPQVLMPLAADLAPPHRRASALSIVLSGLLFGVLIARVLSGIIAEFTSWRVVYYLAIAVQFVVLFMLWFMIPDYPQMNKGLTYGGILYSMAKFSVTEPLLIQAMLVSIASMATFTSFWVTLTFLLGGAPYFYSTLVIGLFGLFATTIASFILILFHAIQTGAGGINIAAVIIVCFGIDVFRQMQQVSLTSSVFGLELGARARLNAVVLISIFIGQVMGTSVGTKVFLQHGWRASAALSLAWSGFCLFIMLIRGPNVSRYTWVGYEGGWEIRKRRLAAKENSGGVDVEKAEAAGEKEKEDVKEDVDVEVRRRDSCAKEPLPPTPRRSEEKRRSTAPGETVSQDADADDERSWVDERRASRAEVEVASRDEPDSRTAA